MPGLCQGLSGSAALVGATPLPISHPPGDHATAVCHPFTGFNAHRSTEGGFGRCVPAPSLRQRLLPFLGSAKAPLHPGMARPRVTPPTRVPQDEDIWARGGGKGLEVTLARQCHRLPAVPPLIPTLLCLQQQNSPRATFRVVVGSFLRGSLVIRISLYRYKTNQEADTQR